MSRLKIKDRDVVPLADPLADSRHLHGKFLVAIERVLGSGQYQLGPEVKELERRFPEFVGAAYGVGVASGTDALALALQAAGIGGGDEVITVSHTAGPTVAAIHMAGATPVLVDVDSETYCMDPTALDGAVTPRTRAVLPVHLYGHPADMKEIMSVARSRDLIVIEDCAQAHDAHFNGQRVGSIGDLGCFSFYPTKNLGAVGDGGMIVASNEDLIERARQLRMYGWTTPQFSEFPRGRCSRLGELQAAILNIRLPELERQIDRRRDLASRYNVSFEDLPLQLPLEREGARHAYHLYVVQTDSRDSLAAALDRAGIMTGRHYPYPIHVQPGLKDGAIISGPLANTEAMAGRILSLPLFPAMTKAQQCRVIGAVREFFGK